MLIFSNWINIVLDWGIWGKFIVIDFFSFFRVNRSIELNKIYQKKTNKNENEKIKLDIK